MRDLRRILEYKNRKNPALAAGRLFIKSAQSCAGFCYCDLQTCEQRHFIELIICADKTLSKNKKRTKCEQNQIQLTKKRKNVKIVAEMLRRLAV